MKRLKSSHGDWRRLVAGNITRRDIAETRDSFDLSQPTGEVRAFLEQWDLDAPTLVIHGDDDQIVPIDASAKLSAKLVKNSILKVYPGGSHSLGDTSNEKLNKDLFEFIKS